MREYISTVGQGVAMKRSQAVVDDFDEIQRFLIGNMRNRLAPQVNREIFMFQLQYI
jgi:hypothetical protein